MVETSLIARGLTCPPDMPDARRLAHQRFRHLDPMAPSILIRFLATLVLVVVARSALAQESVDLDEAPAAGGELDVRGMECVPQVKEVETRRSIPIQCTTDYEVAGVEVRHKPEGGKWAKIELQFADGAWSGMIPCTATTKRGALKVYAFARNDANKVVGRVGRSNAPMTIRLVEQSKAPAPAFPNKEPPARCYEKTECPPEMLGTAACPGTKASASAKRAWGASCTSSEQCQTDLECLNGSCESPPKCETAKDCPEGAECSDGLCRTPSPEELAERLGPPKHHWFGLHFGADLMVMREADGVCLPDGAGQTEDSKRYACYQAGNPYTGVPNTSRSGHLSSGLRFATVRALMSYEYAFGRLLVGGRLGWAFLGAPKDFSPIHVEARGFYSLRRDVFNKNFRPYLGLAAGYAQVDASGTVTVTDCNNDPATLTTCRNATGAAADGLTVSQGGNPPLARALALNAYRSGTRFFFGPTLHTVFALANDSAIVFNFAVMFPDVVLEPTIGYEMAL